MPLDRNEVAKTLAELAGPLGPFTSLDERLSEEDRWVEGGGLDLMEALADLAPSLDSSASGGAASLEDVQTLLVETVVKLARRFPERALSLFLPLLQNATARPVAIDVLAGLHDERAARPLGQLLESQHLSHDEQVHTVGALGEIGGSEACRLLRRIRTNISPSQTALLNEIDKAIRSAGCGD